MCTNKSNYPKSVYIISIYIYIWSQESGKGFGGGPKTWCMIVNASALLTLRCLATTANLSQASSSMGKGRLFREAAMATPIYSIARVPQIPAQLNRYYQVHTKAGWFTCIQATMRISLISQVFFDFFFTFFTEFSRSSPTFSRSIHVFSR